MSVAPNQQCRLFSSHSGIILQYLIQDVSEIKRGEKGKIQHVVITGSRERAFQVLACFCRALQHKPITCHASVGSLKLERDLKALHFGVDILVVTASRLSRLYYGNENCFDEVQTVILDECELLFSKPMKKKVCYCHLTNSLVDRRQLICTSSRGHSSIFHR